MAKKIKLKDYLANLPVAENLKGFTGVDAANAIGQMTPERLAAVAGGLANMATPLIATDLNTLLESAAYNINGAKDILNMPSRAMAYGLLVVVKSGGFVLQIYASHASMTFFYRVYLKGAAQEWREWKALGV